MRLLFRPEDIEKLYKAFSDAYKSARQTESTPSSDGEAKLHLWPESMRDFLDRELQYFKVKAYILDPTQWDECDDGEAHPQPLPTDSAPMDKEPFKGLLKIDIIPAQRGFSDPKTEDESRSGFASLSTQLRQYFAKHLDPSESPDVSDLEAL